MTPEERIQLLKAIQAALSVVGLLIAAFHGAAGGHAGGVDLDDLLGVGGLIGLGHWALKVLKG